MPDLPAPGSDLEIAPGVFKPLADCTPADVESAADLYADRLIAPPLTEAEYYRYIGEYLAKEAVDEGAVRRWR